MLYGMRSHSFWNTLSLIQNVYHANMLFVWNKRTGNFRTYCCSSNHSILEDMIRLHTVVSRRHFTPEITLNLITPECELWHLNGHESPFIDPYWAFYWPGGQALSRFLLDNPQFVANKTVLDVGCGSGACSIAAALSGAAKVVANDVSEAACIATSLNASLNNVRLETKCTNLIGGNIFWDCILVGDVFYDEEFSRCLYNWLNHGFHNGKSVLIGDADRIPAKISQKTLRLLKIYELPENVKLEYDGLSAAQVWSF